MSTEMQAKSQAENWARYVLSGASRNMQTLLPPDILPYREYKAVHAELTLAVQHLDAALEALVQIQLARKTP